MIKRRGAAGVAALLCAVVALGPWAAAAHAVVNPLVGYGSSGGAFICDNVDEINPAYADVACAPNASAFVGATASTVGFGLVIAVDPRTSQNGGPLESMAYVVAIAVNGTQVATVGVDGKQVGGADYVYAKCFGDNAPLTYSKTVNAATADGTFSVTPTARSPYHRVDFDVPLSALSSCGITASTPVQLYYGTSAAANLDVINKDYFRSGDSAVSFTGLATVTFGGTLSLSKSVTHVSGPNPPAPGQQSTYDLVVTASNPGVYALTGVNVTDTLPGHVQLVSRTSSRGSTAVSGQQVTWSGFDLAAGTSGTLTMRVTTTPTSADVGSPVLLNAGASGTAARADGTTASASSNAVSSAAVSGPRLTIAKTAAPTFVAAGGAVSYTISLGNTGNATADVTAVTDTLPSGFAFVPGSTGGTLGAGAPTVAGSTLTWSGPFAVAPSTTRTLTFSATASSTPGSYTNTASASASNAATVSTGPTAAVGVNAPPTTTPDSATTARGTQVSIPVLANDSDPDGNPLSLTGITIAAGDGTAAIGPGPSASPSDDVVLYTPPAGFTGTKTFTYAIGDGFGGTASGTVTVTVANRAPVAGNDTFVATLGTTTTVPVLTNDSDPDNDALRITSAGPATSGTATLEADGTVTYTPRPGHTGTDTFSYTITDDRDGTATAVVTVTVPNAPPTAVDDATGTPVDAAATVFVLSNDTDPNAGQQLAVTGITQPANGTAVLNANGSVTYTPPSGYTGTASFTYTVSDGTDDDVGTVTVTVSAGAPVAVADSAATDTNKPITVLVLSNDTDPNNDVLTVVGVTDPVIGPAAGPPSGDAGSATTNGTTVVYTPTNGFAGTATFRYTISDGTLTSTAVITVTVANAAPSAVDDSTTASRTAPVEVHVLGNDSDLNGDALTITGVTATTAGGTAVVDTMGTPAPGDDRVRYTAPTGFVGTDTFTYTVSDGLAQSTATVRVTIANAPPTAGADSATAGTAGSPAPVTIDVRVNDTDPDGDTLAVTSVSAPSSGSAVVSGGSVVYTPAAGFVGTATFTYVVSDGHGGTATGAVTVTVPNANPTAVPDSAAVGAGKSVTVAVLANDTEPNPTQSLRVTAVSAAAHGTVTVNANGTVTYVPVADYTGTDTFTYTIEDGAGGTSAASVVITVTAGAPVAVADAASTGTGSPVTVSVLSNDVDGDGDTLVVVPGSVTTPMSTPAVGPAGGPAGTAVLNPNGSITFTPAPQFTGTATFSYSITDGSAAPRSTATVTITVLNAAPVARPDTATIQPGAPSATIDVLANDSDANSDALTITGATASAPGAAVTVVDNRIRYVPAPGYVGTDTVTYTVSDGRGGTSTSTVSVTVPAGPVPPSPPPVNAPPSFTDDSANTTQTTELGEPFAPLAATDPDGNALTYVLVSGSLPPGVTLTPAGELVGTPTASGTYEVVLRVCDNGTPVLCDLTPLSMTVTAAAVGPPSAPPPPAPAPPVAVPPAREDEPAEDPDPSTPSGRAVGSLPRTGGSVAAMSYAGLLALTTGAALLLAGRRRLT